MQTVLCVLLLACLWTVVLSQKGYAKEKPVSECVYWCKTPEKKFYCCSDDKEPVTLEEHGGKCPVSRKTCHKVGYKDLPTFLPDVDSEGVIYPDLPTFCAHDGVCAPWEKCCFDRCFEKHMCKFAYSANIGIKYSKHPSREHDVVQESTYFVN